MAAIPQVLMKQPLPNTYWVEPGRLLAGEHPCGGSEPETRARLDQLHDAGINYFIDLTEEGEMPDYRPFLPKQTHYLRCPLRDAEAPQDAAQMQELQSRIRTAQKLGRRIYIHCRAGIGRTGLVIGCYLADGGLDGDAALKGLNSLWQQSERAQSWPVVPQTEEQADFVRSWPQHRKVEEGGPGASRAGPLKQFASRGNFQDRPCESKDLPCRWPQGSTRRPPSVSANRSSLRSR